MRDPKERLGYGTEGGADIRSHAFFEKINWKKLLAKEVKPDFVPTVRSKTDTSNVDVQFTSEPVVDSVADKTALGAADAAKFDNFTFAPPSALG